MKKTIAVVFPSEHILQLFSREENAMIDFMNDLVIFTLGIFAIIFWGVVVVAVFVEIFDTITGRGSSKPSDEQEE